MGIIQRRLHRLVAAIDSYGRWKPDPAPTGQSKHHGLFNAFGLTRNASLPGGENYERACKSPQHYNAPKISPTAPPKSDRTHQNLHDQLRNSGYRHQSMPGANGESHHTYTNRHLGAGNNDTIHIHTKPHPGSSTGQAINYLTHTNYPQMTPTQQRYS